MNETLTRRSFLGKTSIYGAGLSLGLSTRLPLAEAAAIKSQEPESLSPVEWRTIEAMTARIIPSGDSPGAPDANCVNFIDKALANEEKNALGMIQNSVAALNLLSKTEAGLEFWQRTPEDLDQLLIRLEDNLVENWPASAAPSAQFFGVVRVLTIMGFLADPKYGGNRDHHGWKLAGYPGPRHHRGGYTDAQMMGEEPIIAMWESKNRTRG